MNIQQEMYRLRLDLKILESYCITTEAGLEAIDPKVFMQGLNKLTARSRAVLHYVLNKGNVTIERKELKSFVLSKKVLKTPYIKTSRNIIYVPLNFNNLAIKLVELFNEQKDSMLLTDKALIDANAIFAGYINSPQDLNKLDVRTVPKLETITEVSKSLGELFNGEDGKDQLPMADVYRSYSEFNAVSDNLVKLSDAFNTVDLKGLEQRVDEFYETLDIIYKKLDDEQLSVSKPVAKSIGNLIYNLADWTALYAMYITKLDALIRSHEASGKKLNSFF